MGCQNNEDFTPTPPGPENTIITDESPPVVETPAEQPIVDVRFIAMGDVGTGESGQYQVAQAIATKCEADGCDFVLLLGDNIYNNGVSSLTDEQFQTKFELPFEDIDIPFYLALGNHDYGGDGGGWEYYRSLFQIDYSGVSSKWRMPDHYYRFTHENVGFFALDTNAQLFGLDKSQREKMSAWIAESDSEWKIAFGHHPYKSNGPHGNAGKYEGISGVAILSGDGVKSFAEEVWCGKVDLYISGHDHSRQWLDDTCQGTVLLVSGAGAKTTGLKNTNPSLYQSDTLGFLYVVIQGDTLSAQFIDSSGTVNFTRNWRKSSVE